MVIIILCYFDNKRKAETVGFSVSLYYLIVVYLIVKYTPIEHIALYLLPSYLIIVKNLNSEGINFPKESEFVAATNFSSK